MNPMQINIQRIPIRGTELLVALRLNLVWLPLELLLIIGVMLTRQSLPNEPALIEADTLECPVRLLTRKVIFI